MLLMRGHHEGSIYQRGTGEWIAAVTMRNGKRATRWSKSRDEAKVDLAELLRLRDAGARETGRVRLGPYLERWVASDDIRALAPATWRKHESAIRTRLVPSLGGIRLSELRPTDVGAFLSGQGDLDPQSRRHLRATLRRALADAVRDGLVPRNAAALAHAPTVQAKERAILTGPQAKALIESTRGTRNGPLWTILVTTGLRISEALGLTWGNVTPDAIRVRRSLQRVDGEWTFREPKTAKGRRTIPLTELGREALREQRTWQAERRGAETLDGLVFTTEKGNAIHASNLLPPLRADLAAAGLPKVGLHDLRHSCATILFERGLPIEAIADILGHSTTRVTADLYRHRVERFSDLAAEKMQEALG